MPSAMHLPNPTSFGLILVLLGAPAAVPAAELLQSSPFLPPGTAATAAADSGPLELRSIVRLGDTYEFSIYDTAKKQSTWVKLNETGNEFVVKSHDVDRESITIEQNSRTLTLALQQSKITPLGESVGRGRSRGGFVPGQAGGLVPGQAGVFFGRGGPGGGRGNGTTDQSSGVGTVQAMPAAGPVAAPGASGQLSSQEAFQQEVARRRSLRQGTTSGQTATPANPPPSGQRRQRSP
jgi:hypothetical protein